MPDLATLLKSPAAPLPLPSSLIARPELKLISEQAEVGANSSESNPGSDSELQFIHSARVGYGEVEDSQKNCGKEEEIDRVSVRPEADECSESNSRPGVELRSVRSAEPKLEYFGKVTENRKGGGEETGRVEFREMPKHNRPGTGPDSDPERGMESRFASDSELICPQPGEKRRAGLSEGSEKLEPGTVAGHQLITPASPTDKNRRSKESKRVWKSGGTESTAEKHLKEVEDGVSKSKCFLPFLVNAPRTVNCGVCHKVIHGEEKIVCSVHGCQGVFDLTCAKESIGHHSSKHFKCLQHACFLCKQKCNLRRCMRCPMAWHDKCAAFPEHVVYLPDRLGEAICWRHPTDWKLEEHEVPTVNIEEIFCRLPLPYMPEEFEIDLKLKGVSESKLAPSPYVHIKRNTYLIKRKRDDLDSDIGCTSCSSTNCSKDCVCRVQCISCSKACHCSAACMNRPFRKEKRIQVVKTELCGWGVVAAESINKGDFVIEYVGEVINDALCEQRLWDMKDQELKNFYICEVRKDFIIDATFKGNSARFLNHSCDPNCELQKWQVDGETRIGVFASRVIQIGEPLTYDYRFVQFGPEVKCHCGAPNCQGFLGTKKKIGGFDFSWGSKRRRSSMVYLN